MDREDGWADREDREIPEASRKRVRGGRGKREKDKRGSERETGREGRGGGAENKMRSIFITRTKGAK